MLTRIYSFVLGDEKKVNKSIENGEVNMGQRAKDDSRSGPSQQKQRDIGVDPRGSLTSSVNQRRRSNQAGLQRKDDGKIGGVVEVSITFIYYTHTRAKMIEATHNRRQT